MKMAWFQLKKIMVLWIVFTGTASIASADTLSLKNCLKEAIESNPALKEAELGVKAGEKSVLGAEFRHLPKISLDGNYTSRQDPIPFISAQSIRIPAHFSDEYASWQAVMSIPVYQGGQIQNNVNIAEIKKASLEDSFILTKNEIIANTVNTYNKLLHLGRLKKSSEASVKALEEQHKNISLMYKLGRMAKIDFLKIDVQLANEKQRLATINEGILIARETLSFLMGRDSKPEKNTIEPEGEISAPLFSADFEKGIAEALENRPEYRIAKNGIKEAELNIKNSVGKLLPSVSAFGGYLDQSGFDPSYREANWFTGVNASMPIFEGSLYSDISRDRILKEKSEARLKSVENQIRLDVRNAISSISESRKRIEASEKAVRQAEESFRIEREKYTSGAGAMVDLLLAQAADFNAAANYAQAIFDYNAAIVAYRRATGSMEEYLK